MDVVRLSRTQQTLCGPGGGEPSGPHSQPPMEPMVRDLIAVYLDVPPDSFAVNTQVELPDSVRYRLELVAKLRQEAADAQAAAAEEYRRAAAELKAGGLTVRDIGVALGISHQRVQQLVASHQSN
jgi:hypothetical protein